MKNEIELFWLENLKKIEEFFVYLIELLNSGPQKIHTKNSNFTGKFLRN